MSENNEFKEGKKKKYLIAGLTLGIVAVLGFSYALWQTVFTQTGENKLALGCFSTTFAEEGTINVAKAFPITDEEGMTTDVYSFTIKNTCDTYASYQVNLEVLASSTLGAQYVKAVLNNRTPKTLVQYENTTKTIAEASSAYKLITGGLAQNEEITYDLRIWVDSEATQAQTANTTFASKVAVITSASAGTLAETILLNNGGVSAITAKGAPDFAKTSPYIVSHKESDYAAPVAYNSLSVNMWFGTGYIYDEATGKFKLTGVERGIATSRAGMYTLGIATESGETTGDNASNSYIYKIETHTAAATTSTARIKSGTSQPIYSKEDSGMYAAEDDYGTSYYFRGDRDQVNNNVLFGGYQWKIIRITGSGDIKLIYNGTEEQFNTNGKVNTTGYDTVIGDDVYPEYFYANISFDWPHNFFVGYMHGNSGNEVINSNSSNIKSKIDEWYNTNINNEDKEKIADSIYCNDRSIADSATHNIIFEDSTVGTGLGNSLTAYKGLERLRTNKVPNLICPQKHDAFTVSDTNKGNGDLIYPVGLITADEIAMAGVVIYTSNPNCYLSNNNSYWTMTPAHIDFASEDAYPWVLLGGGGISPYQVDVQASIRPVIALKANVNLTGGNGTSTNPYRVS